mmetsp:Transcript_8455/g.16953  ORF Transcript_8455/g.16953 Transcript_8455/m.16953 type:complete len:276 (+) Transcript_8455:52-879(+)
MHMFSVHSSSSRLFTLLLILAVLSQISQGFTFIIPRSTTSGALSPSSSPLRSTSAARSSPLFSTTTHKLDGNPIRGPITPVGNFVVCRVKDVLTTTQGGILLPDQSKTKPNEGFVISVGPGRTHPHTGLLIPNACEPGDSVLYGKFDGTKIDYDDEDCNVIRDDDVIMIYRGSQMTLENVRPAKDYILVKFKKAASSTATGIAIAAAATKDLEPCAGRVIMMGEGRTTSEGDIKPCPFKVGDEVKFRDYAGQDVNIEGEEYVAVRMADVLSVMRE